MWDTDDKPTLSKSKLWELRSTLTTQLLVDVAADGGAVCPRGAVDYHATFNVQWRRAASGPRPVDRDFQILAQLAHEQGHDPNGENMTLTVGRGQFVIVDAFEPELGDALDARDSNLQSLASALLLRAARTEDEFGSVLLPEVMERIELVGSYGVLVDRVDVHPAFRGAHLGLLAAGAALAELRRGCSFAAVHAMQPGLRDHEARRQSHERLSQYWGRLGFSPLSSETMLLSLGHVTFDDAIAVLRR